MQWEFNVITTMLPATAEIQILQFIYCQYDSPGLTLDIFLFPVPAQGILFSALPPFAQAHNFPTFSHVNLLVGQG